MALKATIFKAQISLSDMDRNLYQDFSLTLARHPSETDRRMMIRLAAFAWHAAERLEFTKGALCRRRTRALAQELLRRRLNSG